MIRPRDPRRSRTFALVSAAALTFGFAVVSTTGVARAETTVVVIDEALATSMGAERAPNVAVALAPSQLAHDARDHATPLVRPPMVNFSAGNRRSDVGDGLEIGASVTQEIPLRSVGAARKDAANALGHLVANDVARARLYGGARAATAWVGVVEAKEVARLRRDALDQAKALATLARARVDTGVGLPEDRALAEADVGAATVASLDAEGSLVEARAELRFALDIDPSQPIDTRGDLYTSDEPPTTATSATTMAATMMMTTTTTTTATMATHPNVATALARADLARKDANVAAAVLGPSLLVGVSYLHEGTRDRIAMATIGVPIPLFNPAGYEESRLRVAESQATANVGLVRAELKRDAQVALHERSHWREVRDAVRAQSLGPSREALRLARVAYEAGTQGYSAVLLARQRVAAAEEQLARAAANVRRADLRLAYVGGTLLSRGAR